MASPAEILKPVRCEASRHTCTASFHCYNLDLAKLFVPTGPDAGDRWPHADHYLRSCFRTNVPQHTPARGSRPLGAAAWGRLPVGPTRVAEKFECKTCRTEFAGSTRRAIG